MKGKSSGKKLKNRKSEIEKAGIKLRREEEVG
jgi:hypothetical protein